VRAAGGTRHPRQASKHTTANQTQGGWRTVEVKPVGCYLAPSYPTQRILGGHPELLRLVPERWRRNRLVLTGLGLVCSLLVAPGRAEAAGRPAIVGEEVATAAPVVAPLFVHGDGIGGTGCVAVSPPVFLTEDEALHVIAGEARHAGLLFEANARPAVALDITALSQWPPVSSEARPEGAASHSIPAPTTTVRFTADLADRSRGISVEFISREDAYSWPDASPEGGSIHVTRAREVADRLGDGLSGSRESGAFGTFYDPCCNGYDLIDMVWGINNQGADTADWGNAWRAVRGYSIDWLQRLASDEGSCESPKAVARARRVLAFFDLVLAGKPPGPLWRSLDEETKSTLRLAVVEGLSYDGRIRALSQALLREQVRDFVAWLKAEGVI